MADSDGRVLHDDYWAANPVGRVDCVAWDRCGYFEPDEGEEDEEPDMHTLAIDEDRIPAGRHLAWMEGIRHVLSIVSQDVVDSVREAGLSGVVLTPADGYGKM